MTKFRKMCIGGAGLTLATALSGVATAGTCATCGDDVQIEASIKTSFQNLPYLDSVHVHTLKHVAYLSGEVSSELMSRTAAEITNGTTNVERVVNNISVAN